MQLSLLVLGRVLLSVHFLTELYDKLTRFKYWVVVCEESGQPYPVLEMLLVTALLLFGAPCLLLGVRVRQACLALTVFQIPTTVFFESSLYTQLDSVSVIGGLLMAAAIDWSNQSTTPPPPVPMVVSAAKVVEKTAEGDLERSDRAVAPAPAAAISAIQR